MSLSRPQVDATLWDPNQVSEVLQNQGYRHHALNQKPWLQYDDIIEVIDILPNGEVWIYVYDYETGELIDKYYGGKVDNVEDYFQDY